MNDQTTTNNVCRAVLAVSCGALLASGAALLTACAEDGSATLATPPETTAAPVPTVPVDEDAGTRVPVILDYSPTISDAGALLYLALRPDVDLLAVTLPGTGEADCDLGVRTTVALLTLAGRPDVPVGCGRDEPLVGDRDWPAEWRDAANRFPGVLLPSVGSPPVLDAETMLVEALSVASEPVTIVAVGPLTNLGVVLPARRELHDSIARIVVMGGAADVPGNVDQAPAAEWNFHIDPEAVRRVFESGVPVVMVGLDATNTVPWTDQLVRRLGTLETAAGVAEHQIVSTRGDLTSVYLWDELAALAALEPGLVTLEQRSLVVDDDGATADAPDGATVSVAVGADAAAAVEEFLTVLNGGSAPAVATLDLEGAAYLDAMAETIAAFDAFVEEAFSSMPDYTVTDRVAAAALIGELLASVGTTGDDVARLEPPDALAEPHATFVAAAAEIGGLADSAEAAAAADGAADFFSLLDAAMTSSGAAGALAELTEACRAIDDFGILRGHEPVCGELADAA